MKDWLRNIFKDKKGWELLKSFLLLWFLWDWSLFLKERLQESWNDFFEKIVSQTSRI